VSLRFLLEQEFNSKWFRAPKFFISCKMQATHNNVVTDDEIAWMLSKRPLEWDFERAERDYSEAEAEAMVHDFRELDVEHLLPCTNWPGVGSRWKVFLDWVKEQKVH
jgi:hypothetical protein